MARGVGGQFLPVPLELASAIVAGYLNGATYAELAAEHGIGWGGVRNVVIRAGITPRRGGPRQAALSGVLTLSERRQRVFVLYVLERLDGPTIVGLLGGSSEGSPTSVAHPGLTVNTVYDDLKALGVERRDFREAQRRGRTRPCAQCGRVRYVHRSRDRDVVFCSSACANRWRNARGGFPSALISPSWKSVSRQRWHGRISGHAGGAAGIEAGRALGGRKPLATPEQQQRMLELDRGGWSTRQIAAEVFGDSRYKDRVARFLHR